MKEAGERLNIHKRQHDYNILTTRLDFLLLNRKPLITTRCPLSPLVAIFIRLSGKYHPFSTFMDISRAR